MRDYRTHNGDNQVITGGSAFNIKSKSLRLGNFTQAEVSALYAQRTEVTGQAFRDWRYRLRLRAYETAWYVSEDGRLNLPKLLDAFQQFFRENSDIWIERFDYQEAGPQLLMQAFLAPTS